MPEPPATVPLAVVMISLNEEHNIADVCQNLAGWAQEVLLVDSYSADATVETALRHGVTVVQRRFRGFGDQWNFAMTDLSIRAPWTMKLDPDERLTDELKSEIASALRADRYDAFSLQRRLWFMGRPMPVRQEIVRVWRTGRCRFTDVAVNEYPMIDGKIGQLKAELEHHDSPSLHHWYEKQNRYSTAEARIAVENRPLAGRAKLFGNSVERRMWWKTYFRYVPFRFALLFLYNYLLQGAWRSGWVGYAWARLRSDVYRMAEYKRREMELNVRARDESVHGQGTPDPRVKQYD